MTNDILIYTYYYVYYLPIYRYLYYVLYIIDGCKVYITTIYVYIHTIRQLNYIMFSDKMKTITILILLIIIIITCHLVPTQLQLEESV